LTSTRRAFHKDEERTFLHELKGEAKQVSRAFELLFGDIMEQPPEQRTSGYVPFSGQGMS
jgi:hypothetical protein